MNQVITVMYNPDDPNHVVVSDDGGDPWDGIALLLEGLGVLVAACANNGKISHNEQSVEDYLKGYVGKICNDYKTTRPLSHRN